MKQHPALREAAAIWTSPDRDLDIKLRDYMAVGGSRVHLGRDHSPRNTGKFKDKAQAVELLQKNIGEMAHYQEILYAQNTHALLIMFQALDAAGKDSAIEHVMSGVNPQGCHVTSFKVPSADELDHDFLWRAHKVVPARGMIGIFNRSYYEEVLVLRVHPELLEPQHLPPAALGKGIWARRFQDINNFEEYLTANGIVIVKFFLNVSREEQKERFLQRLRRPEKNWKFSARDVTERRFWKDYQRAYEDCIRNTSTPWAPWFIIPADHKWFTRLAVSEIITNAMKKLNPKFPEVSAAQKAELRKARALLEREK